MEENEKFNFSQHGFRSGRSCVSQLLINNDKIMDILESGANVDAIYLDFAKAFDKVDHAIVLKNYRCWEFEVDYSTGLSHSLHRALKWLW